MITERLYAMQPLKFRVQYTIPIPVKKEVQNNSKCKFKYHTSTRHSNENYNAQL